MIIQMVFFLLTLIWIVLARLVVDELEHLFQVRKGRAETEARIQRLLPNYPYDHHRRPRDFKYEYKRASRDQTNEGAAKPPENPMNVKTTAVVKQKRGGLTIPARPMKSASVFSSSSSNPTPVQERFQDLEKHRDEKLQDEEDYEKKKQQGHGGKEKRIRNASSSSPTNHDRDSRSDVERTMVQNEISCESNEAKKLDLVPDTNSVVVKSTVDRSWYQQTVHYVEYSVDEER